jgi:hypothetical protein
VAGTMPPEAATGSSLDTEVETPFVSG